MATEGQKVRVSYVGTFDDGEVFDSTESHGGELLEFVVGDGNIIKGFDDAVRMLEVGETIKVPVEPAEAYGEYDPEAVQQVPIEQIPNGDQLADYVGKTIYMQDFGGPVPVKVVEVVDGKVTFDFNHPMAGKRLNFEITLVAVEG